MNTLQEINIMHTYVRQKTGRYLLSCVAAMSATPAFAQLSEAESTATWVLDIFSPALMLAILTIFLIGCGIAVWMGKLSGGMFIKLLLGAILVFGARTVAPKIIALF